MRRWFDRLPVHRTLVAMALVVSTSALVAAASGLMLLDVWRHRAAAGDDATTLARIIAENTAAAAQFEDPKDATEILSTVRVRDAVTRACIFLNDGRLLATYQRSPDHRCPPFQSEIDPSAGYALVPIVRNQREWGWVYVERDLSDLGPRLAVTALAALAMLLLAGGLAFALAQRLNRTVSRPIAELAMAAKGVGRDLQFLVPEIAAPQNEIGDLVSSFQAMIVRVREANAGLRREIEERRRVEAEREMLLAREREAGRLKDEFLAAVSHELRTPLNAILGWVQILTSTDPTEQTTAKAIASIARNAQAQTRVIEDLVDVSRMVTGKLHLRLEPMDLSGPVESAMEVVRPAALVKNIQVSIERPEAECLVMGDRDRLQQIVWNLLSNAVKFTPPAGRITVAIRENEAFYEVEVADTGPGIAPEFLPYVFDRFRQADGSMTREHGGLGLGLAIVKDLTELHGGSVEVGRGRAGSGASFTVRVPALAGSHRPAAPLGVEIDGTSHEG
jgi:signal transduction histidine kinase